MQYEQAVDLNPGTLRHTLASDSPISLGKNSNQVWDPEVKLKLEGETLAQHVEHGTLVLPKGELSVYGLKEYNPWLDATTPVFD